MIDGINITLSITPDQIRQLLDFIGFYNERTCEPLDHRKPTAELNGLLFIIAGLKQTVKVKGSVHKFANKGKHNHDRFTLLRFREVESDLLPIVSPLDQVHGIEFGVNLITSFDPSVFIRNLIAIRGKSFNRTDIPGKCYAESRFSQYIVKIYDKGKQYGTDNWILRIEINYFKLARLFPNGLQWKELSDPETWEYLGKRLSRMFEEVICWDPAIDITKVPEREKSALKDGHNPLYWEGIKGNDQHGRKRKKFQGLINKYGSSFSGIKDLIKQEINQLIDMPAEVKGSDCYHFADQNNVTSLSDSYKNKAECYPLLSCNNQPTSSPPIPNVMNCLVTGIDISHQKKGSKFLSETSIRWIFKIDREQYLKLQNKYLTNKRKNESLNIQFREIAHQIRNKFNNPKHNTRHCIERITRDPVLFGTMAFIDPVKLRRAEL